MEDNRVFKKMKIAINEDKGYIVTNISYYKWFKSNSLHVS